MADEMRGREEAGREAPAASPQAAEPQAPAERRSVRSQGARDVIFKHANDRRTLDRMLARMRGR